MIKVFRTIQQLSNNIQLIPKVFGTIQQLSNNIHLIPTSTAQHFCVMKFSLLPLYVMKKKFYRMNCVSISRNQRMP